MLAAAATGVYQASFFASVDRTGAAVATVVALGTAPSPPGCAPAQRTASASPPPGGPRPPARWPAALLSSRDEGSVDGSGVALALVSGGCYGAYTVSAKRFLRPGRPVEGAVAASLLGGALLLLPGLADGAAALATPRGAGLVAWLGLVTTALAYVVFVRGLRRVTAATAGTLSLAEPFVALLLGAAVLHERLTAAAAPVPSSSSPAWRWRR